MKRIGFIGCGNMGRAMVGGLINSGFSNSSNIIVSTRPEESAKLIQEKYNVNVTTNNEDVIKNSDVIFLAVKPNMYAKVIGELRKELLQEKLIITIAAGITISDMEALISDKARIVRTMPNTPALVGEGMSAICTNNNVLDEELVILGDLTTYRIETQYQNELLVLDKSEYLNKVDYELEYEVSSYDEGYEKFKQLLQEFDIKHKKPLNKVQRFFEEKKKASDK